MSTAVSLLRYAGRPQRQAQPDQGASLPRRHQDCPPASSRNRRTRNSPSRAGRGCEPVAAMVGHDHLDLPACRVGDVDLDPARTAVGGRVVDQVLDGLAEHGPGWPRPRPGRPPGRARSPRGPRRGPGRRPAAAATSGAASAAAVRRRSPSTSAASCVEVPTSARSSSSIGGGVGPWSRSRAMASPATRTAATAAAARGTSIATSSSESWLLSRWARATTGADAGRHAEATAVVSPCRYLWAVNVCPQDKLPIRDEAPLIRPIRTWTRSKSPPPDTPHPTASTLLRLYQRTADGPPLLRGRPDGGRPSAWEEALPPGADAVGPCAPPGIGGGRRLLDGHGRPRRQRALRPVPALTGHRGRGGGFP